MSDLILPPGVSQPEPEPEDGFQLYPSEEQLIASHWQAIQEKFMGMPDTKQNLHQMAREAEARFKEAGFIVEIDLANMEFVGSEYVVSPVITVIDRIKKEKGHDHEKHAGEVQMGLQDGRAFGLNEQGKAVETKKIFKV